MTKTIKNGSKTEIDGKSRIYYDGYWIRYYAPPAETLTAKKELLDMLTRRTFHHTESGINTPGVNLELARTAWETQIDPAKKRVNAAMLAGALFNRAADIFGNIVELEKKGIHINNENELMQECGSCLKEALELGKQVRHPSGHEGVDELWGEPFKVFTHSLAAYYESRYIKISQTMRAIDSIAKRMIQSFKVISDYKNVEPMILDYAAAARDECELMKSDPDFFSSWPHFVALGERIIHIDSDFLRYKDPLKRSLLLRGRTLLIDGKNLLSYMAGVRVPMPKSMSEYCQELEQFDRAVETLQINSV
tara:strand:- start:1323 stop:2243 length:921 start_codon:yes stop_codon:yes gene_type:complete